MPLFADHDQAGAQPLQASTGFRGGSARVIAVDPATQTIKFQMLEDQNGG